jgi:hypothetical protein
MKALKGLIEAINGGIPLTLYRNSYDAIAQHAAKVNFICAQDLHDLATALEKTSPRFSRDKFYQAVAEYANLNL